MPLLVLVPLQSASLLARRKQTTTATIMTQINRRPPVVAPRQLFFFDQVFSRASTQIAIESRKLARRKLQLFAPAAHTDTPFFKNPLMQLVAPLSLPTKPATRKRHFYLYRAELTNYLPLERVMQHWLLATVSWRFFMQRAQVVLLMRCPLTTITLVVDSCTTTTCRREKDSIPL